MKIPTMHIYAQSHWHDEARIIANREALTALRDAIDEVLNASSDGRSEVSNVFAGDGEGYNVEVEIIDGQCHDETWDKLKLPYVDVG